MRPPAAARLALAAALLAGVALVAGSFARSPERDAAPAPLPQDRSTSPSRALFFAPHPAETDPSAGFGRLAAELPGLDAQERRIAPAVHEFFFTRAVYSSRGGGWGRRQSWATDYPKADHQFMTVVNRLTNLDGYGLHNAVALDDPAIRRFPFLYALEVGYMRLSPPEVEGLRDYLEAGGFLVVDDFWGQREWLNFRREIARVLPGREVEELGMDHPVFRSFYDIDRVRQVPGFGRGIRGGPTWEKGGVTPRVFGIHDDAGRLMVVVNFNTDLGDAWEHAESPYYPLEYSTYAYEMGVNMIVYGMSH